ncbi:MAG TPA: hypothetical protein VFE51_04610 [Verrucomicrobiae bacterium]|nr:hypothetical protein [Verrucomicrobiae bacterium]
MSVGNGSQHLVQDESSGGLHIFLVAGGTKPAALAGEGQQVFLAAMVAAHPGKTAGQVAATEKFADHLGNDGAQAAVTGWYLSG